MMLEQLKQLTTGMTTTQIITCVSPKSTFSFWANKTKTTLDKYQANPSL
jgi:hypothetical protein